MSLKATSISTEQVVEEPFEQPQQMSEAKEKINEFIEHGAEASTYLKAYLETQFELKKFEAAKVAARSLTSIIFSTVTAIMFTGLFLFLMAALALYLSEVMGSYVYGFLSVAGIILALFLLLLILKKPVLSKLAARKMDKTIYKDKPTPTEYDKQQLEIRAEQLEHYLEDSVKDMPQALSTLKPLDFLPSKIGNPENGGIKNKIVSTVLNGGLSLIRKKLK